jgi:hypothetical protein
MSQVYFCLNSNPRYVDDFAHARIRPPLLKLPYSEGHWIGAVAPRQMHPILASAPSSIRF